MRMRPGRSTWFRRRPSNVSDGRVGNVSSRRHHRAGIRHGSDAVRTIVQKLLVSAGEDVGRWQVAVFARDDINAFALPGGRIGVFEGMFRVADTPGKLAAVLGHEV